MILPHVNVLFFSGIDGEVCKLDPEHLLSPSEAVNHLSWNDMNTARRLNYCMKKTKILDW